MRHHVHSGAFGVGPCKFVHPKKLSSCLPFCFFPIWTLSFYYGKKSSFWNGYFFILLCWHILPSAIIENYEITESKKKKLYKNHYFYHLTRIFFCQSLFTIITIWKIVNFAIIEKEVTILFLEDRCFLQVSLFLVSWCCLTKISHLLSFHLS